MKSGLACRAKQIDFRFATNEARAPGLDEPIGDACDGFGERHLIGHMADSQTGSNERPRHDPPVLGHLQLARARSAVRVSDTRSSGTAA
jgi:hypothetical protein